MRGGRRRRPGPGVGEARTDTGVGQAEVTGHPAGADVRVLRIDTDVHGAVDLGDPSRLVVDYQARTVALVDAILPQGGARIVHLGGGAFAIPRAIAARRAADGKAVPDQLVIERSEAIIRLARRQLGLREAAGLAVRKGDARAVLERLPAASAEMVLSDVFIGQRTPAHLQTVEFMAAVRRVLTAEGVLVTNIVDEAPWSVLAANAAAARTAFPHLFAVAARGVARLRDPGNVLLVASAAGTPLAHLAHRLAVGPTPSAIIGPDRLAALRGRARHDADG